ncbi:hypothetical protein HZA57_09265, partial [Candidatus Poribacteria bacterium]|nr:hypothetical protein [Candidatus Poribacteria bacterium]
GRVSRLTDDVTGRLVRAMPLEGRMVLEVVETEPQAAPMRGNSAAKGRKSSRGGMPPWKGKGRKGR